MARKVKVVRLVRTTYYDETDHRFVTIAYNGLRAKHYRHDRGITDLAKAKRLGAKISV